MIFLNCKKTGFKQKGIEREIIIFPKKLKTPYLQFQLNEISDCFKTKNYNFKLS